MDTADIKCVDGKDYLSIPVSITKRSIAHILSTDLFVFYQPPFTCSKSTVETMCEIFSKLTIKTSELLQWYLSGVFIVNLEQVLKIVLVFPLLTFNQINVGWDKVTSLVGSCPKAKNNSLSLSLSFYYWRI